MEWVHILPVSFVDLALQVCIIMNVKLGMPFWPICHLGYKHRITGGGAGGRRRRRKKEEEGKKEERGEEQMYSILLPATWARPHESMLQVSRITLERPSKSVIFYSLLPLKWTWIKKIDLCSPCWKTHHVLHDTLCSFWRSLHRGTSEPSPTSRPLSLTWFLVMANSQSKFRSVSKGLVQGELWLFQ